MLSRLGTYILTAPCTVTLTSLLLDNNEHLIGDALKNSTRNNLFITSKLWSTHHRPEYVIKAIDKSLNDLQLEYLDLYLMHWPTALKPGDDLMPKDSCNNLIYDDYSYLETWKHMEQLVKLNKTKSIGVSNFSINRLKELIHSCEIKPAVNQIELNPYLVQADLIDFCNKEGIHVTGYSPLGSGYKKVDILNDKVIVDIAKKHNCTSANVCINWAMSKGVSVIPKTGSLQRIQENFIVVGLEEEDVVRIDSLNKNFRSIDLFDNVFD